MGEGSSVQCLLPLCSVLFHLGSIIWHKQTWTVQSCSISLRFTTFVSSCFFCFVSISLFHSVVSISLSSTLHVHSNLCHSSVVFSPLSLHCHDVMRVFNHGVCIKLIFGCCWSCPILAHLVNLFSCIYLFEFSLPDLLHMHDFKNILYRIIEFVPELSTHHYQSKRSNDPSILSRYVNYLISLM